MTSRGRVRGPSPRRLTVVALTALLTVGFAQTTSEKLQQLHRELTEQRQQSAEQASQLRALRDRIANLTEQQRATLDRLDALAQNVSALENEVATLTARTALAERALADVTAQREVTAARVNRLQEDVRQILNTLYRDRSGQYLQLLSQSRSLSDLLIRLEYSNRAGAYHTRVILALKEEVATLGEQQAQQAQRARELADVRQSRQAKLEALKAQRVRQSALLAELRRSEQGQRTLAAQTQAQQVLTARSIDTLVNQVVAERARIEAERQRRLEEERRRREEEARRLREAQERARREAERLAREREAAAASARAAATRRAQDEAARRRTAQLEAEQRALQQRQVQVQQEQQQAEQEAAPVPVQSGPLLFPLPGGRVSAPFGSGGVQWSVLQGAPESQAVSAREGLVLTVTYYAATGWVVIVDHGGYVATYLGLRDPVVQAGNRVAQGAQLGTVGGSPVFGPNHMAFQWNRVQGASRQPVSPGF